jgi:hypothetical protein
MKLEMCYSKFVEFLKKSEVILQHENSSAVYAWEMFRGWQAVIKIQKVWRGHRSRMMVQDSYPIVESSHTVLRATITTFSRVPECVLLTSGCGPAEKTRGGRVSFFMRAHVNEFQNNKGHHKKLASAKWKTLRQEDKKEYEAMFPTKRLYTFYIFLCPFISFYIL